LTRWLSSITAVLLLAATPALAQPDEEEARRTAELELIAATVWQAIVSRDVDALLRFTSPFEDAAQVRTQLTTKDSALACALWETACLRQDPLEHAQLIRTAAVDFFRRRPSARLRVTYLGMPGVLGMESRLDLAILTWLVRGSDADQRFPAHDLSRWGVDHINTCMIYGRATGWRFHSDVGVFFCPNSLSLGPDAR
jgi:hypothetical protein